MPTTVTVNRVQLGEIPGPVSLTCDTGETVYAISYTDPSDGSQGTLQMCVPDNLAPCDTGGLWDLFEAAGFAVDPDPCA